MFWNLKLKTGTAGLTKLSGPWSPEKDNRAFGPDEVNSVCRPDEGSLVY